MTYRVRLVICAVVAVIGHGLLVAGASLLPAETVIAKPQPLAIRVIEAPPPVKKKEPEPEVKPKPEPEAKPEPLKEPKIRPTAKPKTHKSPPPANEPPPPHTLPPVSPTEASSPSEPVFGVSMQSTSQAPGGPAMPVGNTATPTGTRAAAQKGDPAASPSQPAPAEAYAVTRMPLPIGRCAGVYTDEARAAAVEGTVVLDVVVGADGRPRHIHVVRGLPHGLTKAAIAALSRCRFSPGEQDGKAVAVRVRAFKIRFVLREAL